MNSNNDEIDNKKMTPSSAKMKKFMFDLNSFDEPEEEEEDLEPPPPTFSEEELAETRQQGYDEGYKKATEDADASREQYIAQQLNVIANNYNELFAEEQRRKDIFEAEVISLCQVMFNKMFPVLSEEHGREEIEAIIRKAFEQNEGISEIIVYVRPEDKEDINARLDIMSPKPDHLVCEDDESLPAGGVLMKWKDGGAIRDPKAMGEKIADILIKTLATAPVNDQNQESNENGGEEL